MESINIEIEKEKKISGAQADENISMNIPDIQKPRLVVIGGGFGGIELIKGLGEDNTFQVVLFDKHNYHTFQPLLYQVATAGLEPDSIAAPLRRIFKGYKDFYFRMAQVNKIITGQNLIDTSIGLLRYDYLVVATGTTTNYYGNDEICKKSFPMKQVPQALDLRSKILQNFESALLTEDPDDKSSLINIILVGGGPTGVELAGALAELKAHVLPNDLPEINFTKMRIILIESGPKLLGSMSPNASKQAYKYLKDLGVEIFLKVGVKSYDGLKVSLSDGAALYSQTLIWAAGVTGSTIEGINPEMIKGGRYLVDGYNKVNGYNNIFALGDISAMITAELPKGHPQVAQVAIQQGKLLAKNLKSNLNKKPMKFFKYFDKGSMATVGRNKAVVDLPFLKFSGIIAWFTWMFVHLLFLIGFRSKVTTFINWVWNYFTYDRATRLIIRPWIKNKTDVAKSEQSS
jgi:NADH dehydrogenase